MVLFNVLVVLGVGIAACIPLFFIKTRMGRTIVLIVALACAVVGYGVSNAYLYPNYLGWRFEQELKKQPLFNIINQYYPQEFAQFIHDVKQSIIKKEDVRKITALSAQLVNKIFYQSLRQAPDDYIALYLKATLDLYHYLNGQDPRAVVALENGDNASSGSITGFYEKKDFQSLLNHLLDTKRYVIEAGAKTPIAPPTDAQAEPLLKAILTDLSNKYTESVVHGAFSPGQTLVPPNIAAQIVIEFYADILGAGRENAGLIMRHIADLKERSRKNHAKVDDKGKPSDGENAQPKAP